MNSAEGIVTLADTKFIDGLQLLAESVRPFGHVPIQCFSLEIPQSKQRDIERRYPNVEFRSIPVTAEIATLKNNLCGKAERGRDEWLLWLCPFLIASSPFQKTLWLDCDVIVLRHLGKLFGLLDSGPVFTPSEDKYGVTANKPELYAKLPGAEVGEKPLINAGVIGFDLIRDQAVLQSYMHPILMAARDPKIKELISWHDQGALIWAISQHQLQSRIVSSVWNFPVRSIQQHHPAKQFRTYCRGPELFDQLRSDFPSVNVLHWNGLAEKLWHSLGGLPDQQDYTASASIADLES